MEYNSFLEKVINEGIKAAKADYRNNKEKLEGAIDGFNACRKLDPKGLKDLLKSVSEYVSESRKKRADNYWYFRCYEAEMEWVINVVGSAMMLKGLPALIPNLATIRGISNAKKILKEEELEF